MDLLNRRLLLSLRPEGWDPYTLIWIPIGRLRSQAFTNQNSHSPLPILPLLLLKQALGGRVRVDRRRDPVRPVRGLQLAHRRQARVHRHATGLPELAEPRQQRGVLRGAAARQQHHQSEHHQLGGAGCTKSEPTTTAGKVVNMLYSATAGVVKRNTSMKGSSCSSMYLPVSMNAYQLCPVAATVTRRLRRWRRQPRRTPPRPGRPNLRRTGWRGRPRSSQRRCFLRP